MGGGVDVVPRIAGDEHPLGRLGLEGIHVLGLAEQDADDEHLLEQAALLRLAHERQPVAAEQRDVERVGILIEDRGDERSRLELAQCRPVLADDLHLGLELLEPVPERFPRALAVLVIRTDRRPFRVLQLAGLVGEHPALLVGVRAHAKDVVVALRPRDRLGQRLGRHEQRLVLLGPVGDRQADVREERAGDQRDLLAGDQLLGLLHRLGRLALVVAKDDLDLAAEDAAPGVDLLDRHLDGLLVGPGERRADAAEGVDLADLDRPLGRHRRDERQHQPGGQRGGERVRSHGDLRSGQGAAARSSGAAAWTAFTMPW